LISGCTEPYKLAAFDQSHSHRTVPQDGLG
jgi:hypothetical protein